MKHLLRLSVVLLCGLWSSGCGATTVPSATPHVIAAENFLADIARNIAGDRASVSALVPFGIDPHDFQPSPQDLAAVSQSQMLIVNGAGLEGWLAQALKNVGGRRIVVTASFGLAGRTGGYGMGSPAANALSATASPANTDPHFWMDPVLVKTYVNTIRDGFIQMDPAGQDVYRRNADAYSAQLTSLDQWIRTQVGSIPPARRLLVTDHEDLGYLADEYGFQIVGAITPNTSPDAEPSASHIADLISRVRASGVKAIFLDTGTNPQLADQICRDAGCRVIADLYIHSLTLSTGTAATYLDMMRHNVTVIVEGLK
jgi:ABC-type Zn uptake system ZnuABC Zn-binding protein ZnuA